MSKNKCYCGSAKSFSSCCEPIIEGKSLAATPEELMRARYSAHCLKNYEFLVDSTHPEHRDDVSVEEISSWANHVDWDALEVHSSSPGETDDTGYVSFTAHFHIKGMKQELKEDSSFAKVNGEWKYVDGVIAGEEPYRREDPKIGRNDPCYCGSGKKFKKCCGK